MAKTQPTVKQMAAELAQYGRRGDTMLAHINPQEAALLKAMGGSGTINPDTGLTEYWWGSELGGKLYDNTVGVVVGPNSITGKAVETARGITGATAEALQDVASKLGSTVEAIASDPRKLAAVAIMVAYPGAAAAVGEFLLPEAIATTIGATGTAIVGQTAINTAMNGGDVGTALKSALIQQGMPAATAELSKAMSVADTSMLGQLFNKYGAQAATNAGMAAIMGRDPMAALAFSGVQAATDVMLDVTGAKEIISKLPSAAQKSVVALASAKLANRDPSQAVADSLFNSALSELARGYSIQKRALDKGLTALTEDQLNAFPDDLSGQNAAFAVLRNAQSSGTTLSGEDLQNYLANMQTPEGYGNVIGGALASADGSTPGGTQGVTKPNWLQLDAGERTDTAMYTTADGEQRIDVFRPNPNDPTKNSYYTAVYDPDTKEVRYEWSSRLPDSEGMVVTSKPYKPVWDAEDGSQTGSPTSTETTGAQTGTPSDQTTDTTVSGETGDTTADTSTGGEETPGPAEPEPIQVDAEGVPIYAESTKASSVDAPEGYKLLSASVGRNPPPGSYYDPDQNAWFTPGEEGTGGSLGSESDLPPVSTDIVTGGTGAIGTGGTSTSTVPGGTGAVTGGTGTDTGTGTVTGGTGTDTGTGTVTGGTGTDTGTGTVTGGTGTDTGTGTVTGGTGTDTGTGTVTGGTGTGGTGTGGTGTGGTGTGGTGTGGTGTGGTGTGGTGTGGTGTGGTGTGTVTTPPTTTPGTTSNALTNATLIAGIAAGLKTPSTGTPTGGTTGTPTGTTGGTSPFATTPSAPIETPTYKNAYTDFTPLNPLLFSLAGLGPVTGSGGQDNPLDRSATDKDVAFGTSLDNEPQEQSNSPMEWFSKGGLTGQHPMGEPQYYSEGALTSLQIKGDGDGTSDDIPAMVAKDEYVLPADIVSSLGNGSSDAGASVLDQFVRQIRTHKHSNDPGELPPDSVGPLEYLSAAISKGQKHGRNI